jgi:hypothetical protein
MKKNFTTPAFAKVLKEHGIEIDSCFYSFLLKGEEDFTNYHVGMYFAALGRFVATTQLTYNEDDVKQVFPAYPLTEVLGWLPETIICEGKIHQIDFDTVNLTVGYARAKLLEMVWAIEPINISDIITQGLTEGWITKETILNAIKDNAK